MRNTFVALSMTLCLILTMAAGVVAQAPTNSRRDQLERPVPASLNDLRLDAPVTAENIRPSTTLDRRLVGGSETRAVVVRLSERPVAIVAAASQPALARQAQVDQRSRVEQQQANFLNVVRSLDAGATVLAQTTMALNAVILEVSGSALEQLAADPAVLSIRPVIDYEMDLSETVPYIGAREVQNKGFDGRGIWVAVLDSGIDYTHVALGGSGDPAEYAANDPTVIEEGSFPTAKVIGGYDFVGGTWQPHDPPLPLEPDPDPLDDGPTAGHGTAVADIIGGNKGVAPGVSLLAVKVCSSVSTSCSGIALIQGMEFALDPNGDGDTRDHVDIINMSLGSPYGQAYDDDLSQAVENASVVGVLTVASAGNSGNKPYVTGSPAVAPSAISVAQTNVPSAILPLMQVIAPSPIAGKYPAVFQPWSAPLTAVITGKVQFGDGNGGNLTACEAFPADSLSGLIVLVDRGACNFSDKIRYISDAGGLVGIIGLVTPGDPFAGGFGGGDPITIPGFMISQEDSNTLKSGLSDGVVVSFDPAAGLPLIRKMVGSSSRGPTMLTNIVKPEIGAPGASVAAVAGSGTGVAPFGGTSGAAPMVTGSAALLRQAYPDRSINEIKALLMNTAEINIMDLPAELGGDLSPITRIGGGEVRVDRALAAPAAAWDSQGGGGVLSFGFHDVASKRVILTRWVTVRNYTDRRIFYRVTPKFRFPDDVSNGAVQIRTLPLVSVRANGDARFPVMITIDGAALRKWALNSGSQGASGPTLSTFEYDGYVEFEQVGLRNSSIHLAWHVLPRQAGNISLVRIGPNARVINRGVGESTVESYSLIGTSEQLPPGEQGAQSPVIDFRYVGYSTIPVPAGECGPNASFIMAFAVNTWERQTHADAPAIFIFDLDVDQDGIPDYSVLNLDASYSGLTDGRNLTWVQNLDNGEAVARFAIDHETNSGDTVLAFCGDQIGMDARNFYQPIGVAAQALEFYFSGAITDELTDITISPMGEQYLGLFRNGGVGASTIPSRSGDTLQIVDFGPGTNNTETGLLLLYRGGAGPGNEAGIVKVKP